MAGHLCSPSFQGAHVSTDVSHCSADYSVFVGDLAPETSIKDLIAVFRDPACSSAKILLDPVTGTSCGSGFVRFTNEADQQRALVEMQGLHCLSRPSASFSRLKSQKY
ncbi:hypothetical protein B0H10DRAFT_1816353 [Mycena sp. CBHHK59/15]|nr:hypothetical protein B0H10DRAFT_1816353 [Mycena sp. CBHHK59/15]